MKGSNIFPVSFSYQLFEFRIIRILNPENRIVKCEKIILAGVPDHNILIRKDEKDILNNRICIFIFTELLHCIGKIGIRGKGSYAIPGQQTGNMPIFR